MTTYSIVIPTYNGAKFLAETIHSALDQDVDDVEVIVVDDGSSDQSLAIARSFDNVLVIEQPNLGEAAARNAGLNRAVGRFVVFLDHDDILERDALRKHVAAFSESNDLKVVFGSNHSIDERGRIVSENHQRRMLFSGVDVVFGVTPSFSQCMYKKAELLRIGGFDETTSPASDHDINIRILGADKFGYCHGDVVMSYRKHDGQTTGRPSVLMCKHLEVLRAHLGENGVICNMEMLKKAERYWKRRYGHGLLGEAYRQISQGKIRDFFCVGRATLSSMPWSGLGIIDRIWWKRQKWN